MKRIALLFLCCLFVLSCTNKPKAEKQTTQQNAKAVKEVNTTPKKAISKEETIKTEIKKPQIKLDYSLKAEQVKTLKDSANYLTHYYNQFTKTKDSLSEVLFFKMLPDNFKDYEYLYGYEDPFNGNSFKGGPLTSSCQIYYYVPLNISQKNYFEKLINITVDLRWQADCIGSGLQNILFEKWNSDFVLFDEILRAKTDKEIESFWVFFFDGPHPEKPSKVKRYNEIISKLEEIDPKMIPMVEQAYAFVKDDWDDHGH